MKSQPSFVIKSSFPPRTALRLASCFCARRRFVPFPLRHSSFKTHSPGLRVKSQIFSPAFLKSASSRALKGLLTATLTLVLCNCSTQSPQPVIVQVDAPSESQGRFRVQERQRDVWIAPQATEDALLHEQVVTFVEKPQSWQLPSTIEPHTVSSPDMPLEQAEYDAEVLRRQQEMIQDKENQIIKTQTDLDKIKQESQSTIKEKDQSLNELKKRVDTLQQELNSQLQKKAEEEAARNKPEVKKSWWKFW
jgi:hypothetical protein